MDIAVTRDLLIGIAPFVAGLVVVGMLIGAFVLGRRIRDREPAPPTPEEQPHLPPTGPVREIQEEREPEEVPQTDFAHRLLPHEFQGFGNEGTHSSKRPRPTWSGKSGGFGSGGVGG
ncbi:DUF6479 family protein [Streptomyces sp. GC420]|uniref:DUF6479 family protein n=1 Tax=Streptomyces sp. GC420 TaxID=2697568 RepID=UPI001414E254|nr:DUF6479 family protein [Streptomyces sp. GC420]NBM18376.1 hypothetical protein [Streptomyces sp. GC420]